MGGSGWDRARHAEDAGLSGTPGDDAGVGDEARVISQTLSARRLGSAASFCSGSLKVPSKCHPVEVPSRGSSSNSFVA